jgi:UDP-N-acetylmuramate: L-alanyl-gamma-D-glutamyl-meso-diaminopimelate ligase
VSAFDAADRIVFPPVGRPEIPESERLDLARLVADLRARGRDAELVPTVDAIVAKLADEARAGDTIALLSNGAFGGIYEKLRIALAR